MTTQVKFAEAFLAVAGLPGEAQEMIAEEVLVRVSDLSRSLMSVAQRREVQRRLAKPRRHASNAEVRALFRHYNPAL